MATTTAAVVYRPPRLYKPIISLLTPKLHHLLSRPPPFRPFSVSARSFLACGWAARQMSAELSTAPPRSTQKLFLPRHAGLLLRSRLGFPRNFGDDIKSKTSAGTLSSTLLDAEKKEARAVLSSFLRKRGLGSSAAASVTNKFDHFIDLLISRLHSVQKSPYLVGREMTTLEIREALLSYLESLVDERGEVTVDFLEKFSFFPCEEASIKPTAIQNADAQISISDVENGSKKLKAMARVSEVGPNGQLLPLVQYLLEFGMDLSQIKDMTRRLPAFAYYSLEGKVKPLIDLLLNLGVPKSDIIIMFFKRPQLCSFILAENIKPSVKNLEKLGVDESQWANIIRAYPALLTCSHQKLQASVDYLYEMGVSADNIGKIVTRYPQILGCSVDGKLRPTGEYFKSMGVDVAGLLYKSPQTFGLSLEANLKLVTEFFMENGYDIKDIGTMASRFASLFAFSLSDNLIPKWEFFLTLGYSKSELVKFPTYFGYSLEKRIKPRYAKVKSAGVTLVFSQVLFVSDEVFEKMLQTSVLKMSNSSVV